MKVFKDNLRYALHLDETTSGKYLWEIVRKNHLGNKDYDLIENVISEYVENLSIGIQNLIHIFEPEVIGIGGSFVYFRDVLLPRLEEKIKNRNQLDAYRKNIKIQTAILGNDAGIIGAV